MLYIDDFFQFSTKISHDENGDNAFSLIFDTSPSSEEKIAVFCVMDGVSNSNGAAESSSMASKEIRRTLTPIISDIDELINMDETCRMKYFFSMMRKAILAADNLLWNSPGNYACTASVAIVFGSWVYTANIGDSPIYMFDNMRDSLTELFTCHNEAGYKVRSGEITKEEALKDKSKNILKKVVGGRIAPLVEGDISTMRQMLPQDGVLLLGSDGALSMFDEQTLLNIVIDNRYNMKKLCNEMYKQIIAEKGKDDSTLIATRICIGF